MNEQEQQVVDILIKKGEDLCEYIGEFEEASPDYAVIEKTANEIFAIFEPPHKDTRSKRERKLDEQFAAMDVKPRIYHFTKEVATFNAVTVALAKRWRKEVTEDIVKNCVEEAHDEMGNKATFSIAILKQAGIYDVAICHGRDPFIKRKGRNKAKGQLMQHLLWEGKK